MDTILVTREKGLLFMNLEDFIKHLKHIGLIANREFNDSTMIFIIYNLLFLKNWLKQRS